MQTCVDEVVGWRKAVVAIPTVYQGEVLQVCIIVQCNIIEKNYTEEAKQIHLCCTDIPPYDVGTVFNADPPSLVLPKMQSPPAGISSRRVPHQTVW